MFSVSHLRQTFSPRSQSEVHNDTLHVQFSRCLYNPKCYPSSSIFLNPEANPRYTTILCNANVVAANITPIAFSTMSQNMTRRRRRRNEEEEEE